MAILDRRIGTRREAPAGHGAWLSESGCEILTSNHDEDFAATLSAAGANDPVALRELFDEYGPVVARLVRSLGSSDPDAVVNTAFFDAFRNLGSFRGTDRRAFRSYLFRIASRRVIDEFRSVGRHAVVGEPPPDLPALIDHEASTFDERIADEHLLDEALDQLTSEQREVLELRVVAGFSVRETADRTGRSEVAVKAMQRRALISLRTLVLSATVVVLGLLILRAVTVYEDSGLVVVERGPAGMPAEPVPERTPPVGESGDTETSSGSSTPSDGDPPTQPNSAQQPDLAPASAPASASASSSAVEPADSAVEPVPIVADAACSVRTDGTPAVGEIGFVTYHLDGRFSSLEGSPVQVRGPAGDQAILSGFGDVDDVDDGDRFPFVIDEGMFSNGLFEVHSTVDGGSNRDCRLDDKVLPSVCHVHHDGSPAPGERARVRFLVQSPWRTFVDERTFMPGPGFTSMMPDQAKPRYRAARAFDFTVSELMFEEGEFVPRTAFRDGEALASCNVG